MSSSSDVRRVAPGGRGLAGDFLRVTPLADAWQLRCGQEPWRPATVPGTVADALGVDTPADVDACAWEFRTRLSFPPQQIGERVRLRVGGLATLAELHLNGERLVESRSMFAARVVDVSERLTGDDELTIRCLPLDPAALRGHRPRARWRTRVADGDLRHVRTSLFGRAPGFAPGPPAVGPWRPLLLERETGLAVDGVRLLARVTGAAGELTVSADLHGLDGQPVRTAHVEVVGPTGMHSAELAVTADAVHGTVTVPQVALWWPHTHGLPSLYGVRLAVQVGERRYVVQAGSVGFRTLSVPEDLLGQGPALTINGVPVFARGAVWTPHVQGTRAPDAVLLTRARDAGMNLLRIPGTGVYESTAFHDACDRLGLLVWQDLMLANFDYPFADAVFREELEQEAAHVLNGLTGRPSVAVVCGGSEVEQQAAMVGVAVPDEPFFTHTLPELVAAAGLDAACLPSSPWGGDLPFRTDRGVAHYFGVGAYLRPLTDARLAGVTFASECLALSNVPDDSGVAEVLPGASLSELLASPDWTAGVPRDRGATWDFEDVRDHYLGQLYDVDPRALRQSDPARYLHLARTTSQIVMREVLGEWRRAGSGCAGAVLLWLTDLLPGAGWGVLEAGGRPKPAWHALRHALAPVAVWTTDEGLNGVDIHVANDLPVVLSAVVRVAMYRDGQVLVADCRRAIEVPAHGSWTAGVEDLLGRFVDASYSYRFGPPGHDVLFVSLEESGNGGLSLSTARVPGYWPAAREVPAQAALSAEVAVGLDGLLLTVTSDRFVHAVRVVAGALQPEDDGFDLEPGRPRRLHLLGNPAGLRDVRLTAANLSGCATVSLAGTAG